MDGMQTWMAEVAAWGQGYDAVAARRGETLVWMMEQSDTLITRLIEGDEAAARAWISAWAKTSRERLSAENVAYQALSTTAPTIPAAVQGDPRARAQVQHIALLPDRVGSLLIHSGQAAETYLQVAEATRAGDEEGLLRLGGAMFVLLAANVEAENNMMAGLRGQEQDSNYFWRSAMIESNSALGVWLKHQKAVIFEEAADAGQTAERIIAHARQARSDANAMDGRTRGLMRDLQADPTMQGSAFSANMTTILTSMLESADIERQIAGELETLADAVRRADKEADDASMARFSALVERRAAVDLQRRSAMAAQGG